MEVPYKGDRPLIRQVHKAMTESLEKQLADGVHGWRRKRSVHTAIQHICGLPGDRMAFDVVKCFANIDQRRALKLARREIHCSVPELIVPWLGESGLPSGCSFSPDLANLYLSPIDHRSTVVRYCDNFMLVSKRLDRDYTVLKRHLSDVGLNVHDEWYNPAVFCKTPLHATPGHCSKPVSHIQVGGR